MKNPVPKITLVFLLLLPLLGRAQEIRISGRVVDAQTKEPIPFASIGLREAGTLTNESGYFRMVESIGYKQDSLIFRTLGYGRRALLVEQGKAENISVELSRQQLPGFTSCPVVPSTADQNAPFIAGLPGTQFAFFIGNDKRKQNRKMRSVSFYIGENGLPMETFRIRIYTADGKTHLPAADLLNETVLLTASKGGQWYTSDLSRYNIAVPQEGYFVALDFRQSAEQIAQPESDKYVPSGQIMRPAFDFKDSSMWVYSPEKGWSLFPQSSSSRRYNAMVKVEVEAVE
ncbi:carboxypeptidase-like regulatory domain-containing protein [Hymenobacter sp. UYCo722]|uniref:carboxypeptidase-like regulatory domain-containing protein n=1 Tax=Hymenobacter sp. UYCo722 TaxID=3156335 RepID=UPI0033934541